MLAVLGGSVGVRVAPKAGAAFGDVPEAVFVDVLFVEAFGFGGVDGAVPDADAVEGGFGGEGIGYRKTGLGGFAVEASRLMPVAVSFVALMSARVTLLFVPMAMPSR